MEYNKEIAWRIEELLEKKSFHELSNEEKELVLRELGSEQQYNMLRKIGEALVADKAGLFPDPLTAGKLAKAMVEYHAMPWYRAALDFKIPAYAVVLLLMLMMTASFLIGGNEPTSTAQLQPPAERDTLYVQLPPDTVYIERTVVKYITPTNPSPPTDFSVVKHTRDETSPDGVSMKEKEELEKLLVSGS